MNSYRALSMTSLLPQRDNTRCSLDQRKKKKETFPLGNNSESELFLNPDVRLEWIKDVQQPNVLFLFFLKKKIISSGHFFIFLIPRMISFYQQLRESENIEK